MADIADQFIASLDERVEGIIDACTACGACAEVCPTVALGGIRTDDPKGLTGGIIDILKTGHGESGAESWAGKCCGSGFCMTVCEHGINPRFMLAMARRALSQSQSEANRKQSGKSSFQAMSQGVKVLSRLQLSPEDLQRLSPSKHTERETPPDMIFYTGCNLLKTPHIGLLCLDVMDRLDLSYEVYGGPANCCGILQTHAGDTSNASRQAFATVDRFAETKTGQVLSWCPTCQIQFGEMALPSYQAITGNSFDMTMFPVFLAENLDRLRPMMTERVEKRVALHEFPGSPGVTDAVIELLSAVPSLEIVDLERPRVGYTLNSLRHLPDYQRQSVRESLEAAEKAGVDTFVGVYHSDHREFSAHEGSWPFTIANYMELIGAAMGLAHIDHFKHMKLMQDADAVMASVEPMIESYGLKPEQVREVVMKDLLGEQILPIERADQTLV